MADKLTPQQEQAVWNRGGKLLVSAAAGSGKTKVLVDRLLSYLTDPVDPAQLDEFLIITYTKAAAAELRGKITEKLTERIAQNPENLHLQHQLQRLYLTKISTVHGFCADILREYAYKLDISGDFRVADENECAEIRQSVLTQLLEEAYSASRDDPDFRSFIDSQGFGRDDRLVPEIVQRVYDSARCHLDPFGWLDNCQQEMEVQQLEDASQTLWGKFLINDLRNYLDLQIRVMTRCAQLAAEAEGLEKVAANLWDVVYQLQLLSECELWNELVRKKDINYGRLTFPRKNVDQDLAERIKAARNACKKGLEKKLNSFSDESEQVLLDLEQSASAVRGLVKLVKAFSDRYQKAKGSRRVLDFGDLEHNTLDLLLGKKRTGATAAATEIGARFREIMVDEYQDSNGVQDAIFAVLTRKRNNCFMVGDVKQSIYQFRLADPGIFLEKYNTYVSAETAAMEQGRKILLSHNFRSGAEVIEAVNDVFSNCMRPELGGLYYTEDEMLREGIPHSPLPDTAVEFHVLETPEDSYGKEASFVSEKIHTMLTQGTLIRKNGELQPVQPEDIVILLRSPGSVGMRFQRALEGRGIRCTSGNSNDLMQTEEISTIRSILQIVVNPRQDIPLVSALASPVFGFTADDLAAFRSIQKKGSLFDALQQWDHKKARNFLEQLAVLRKDSGRKSLCQLLERLFSLTHLDTIYGAMDGGEAKRANIQTFFQMTSAYESSGPRDLSQFLEHLAALEGRGIAGAEIGNTGCVTIMSIHKSKGLEFPVVFLAGLARGFNRESMREPVLCHQNLGLGLSVADRETRIRYPSIAKRAIMVKMEADSLSEELRVLYVAMTRARDRLIMTYASKSAQSDIQNASLRQDFDQGDLLCQEAACPGTWVLKTALGKLEAGELHGFGGRPQALRCGNYPWEIRFLQLEDSVIDGPRATAMPEKTACVYSEEKIKKALTFRYPYLSATLAPSKQTATGRKGRVKDEETIQDTVASVNYRRPWRTPSNPSNKSGGKEYGNLIHTVMQHLRFNNCKDLPGISQELERMVEMRILSKEAAASVNCSQLVQFFETPIGQRLTVDGNYIREFKFSLLDPGENYGEDLQGEQILLQGVVDCAILEEDGITILDFKTDRITDESLEAAVNRYRLQLKTYADAMSRIYECPVKACFLYFFSTGQFVKV